MSTAYSNVISANYLRNSEIARFVVSQARLGNYPALVFTREIQHARDLYAAMRSYVVTSGLRLDLDLRLCPVICSETGRLVREHAKTALRQARSTGVPTLAIATDTWSQGIDIPELRAVYNAGGGKAPIGLIQRIGRGNRLDQTSGKDHMIYYDIQDIGLPSKEQARQSEHAEIRLKHLQNAGLIPPDQDLEELLHTPARGKHKHERKTSDRRGRESRIAVQPTDNWAGVIMQLMCSPAVISFTIILLVILSKCYSP